MSFLPLRRTFVPVVAMMWSIVLMVACSEAEQQFASSISEQDSLPFMHATGINTFISDSGVLRYHMVAEEWDIYNQENVSPTWKFRKGLLMQRLDSLFHVDLHVQADTAYLHQQHLWELRGRVVVRNQAGDLFLTEELFWDMDIHEMWSNMYMRIITPERHLEGTRFRSNEQMTRYSVSNSMGDFPVSDTEDDTPAPEDLNEL